ncbi:MAG: rhomboid family intramembrane serine protease [Alistipes sp.]|nr:rhomboid family intramembrane serine protease [Alistipes sp.]MDE6861878.1 rhomboid family intramembrane serine protease [Alistipes sp.]
MNRYVSQRASVPPAVMNLIIANALAFMAMFLLVKSPEQEWDIYARFALHPMQSPLFEWWQPLTYMFMHGSFGHLFFNMFALYMFGRTLEWELGTKRFLVYYFVCGIGAALVQMLVGQIDIAGMVKDSAAYWQYMVTPTVGASGAVFGLLLAFGMMHPNAVIMLLIPPIPIKAKWFVVIYGAIELLFGVSGRMDNVAHFAHLGGMFWGWLLLLWWRKRRRIY